MDRLCRDFSELKTGMKVFDIGCTMCSRPRCGGILIGMRETELDFVDGLAWELYPPCYTPGPGHFSGVDRDMVKDGRIFIVEDGLDLSADTETMKRVEQEAKEAKIDRVLAKVCR